MLIMLNSEARSETHVDAAALAVSPAALDPYVPEVQDRCQDPEELHLQAGAHTCRETGRQVTYR